MNNKQLFTKKLQAKEGAKIKLFMPLLIQGYFLWCLTFFGGFFCSFIKSNALGIKLYMLRYPFSIFSKTFFEVLPVVFENFEAKKRKKRLTVCCNFL